MVSSILNNINNDMIYGKIRKKGLRNTCQDIIYYILRGGFGVLRDQVFNEKGDLLMGADFYDPMDIGDIQKP